jgi:cell filamentation protein
MGVVDPYLDPATGLLRNKIGAQTKVALEEAEGDLVFARTAQLMDHPVPGTGDLRELQEIHRHLFQDVFDWAGQLRTVDMKKNEPGSEFFLPVQMIERAAAFAAGDLANDSMLQGLDRERFVERLAFHYDAFNYIHPFREGNGRTQRVFWSRVADEAGWQLNWSSVQGAVNDAACRAAAERQDLGPLREMFEGIVAPAVPQAHRGEEWRAAELARLAFPAAPAATKEAGYQAPEARSNSRGLGGPGQEKTR